MTPDTGRKAHAVKLALLKAKALLAAAGIRSVGFVDPAAAHAARVASARDRAAAAAGGNHTGATAKQSARTTVKKPVSIRRPACMVNPPSMRIHQ